MTETTYDEYRRAIAAQKQRDRDRFLGIDSHTDEPMYSAETGQELIPEPLYVKASTPRTGKQVSSVRLDGWDPDPLYLRGSASGWGEERQ